MMKYKIDPEYRNPKLAKGIEGSGELLPTICEVHRRIYRLCETQLVGIDPRLAAKIMKLTAMAFDMAKRMEDKLKKRSYHVKENVNTDIS